MCGTSLARPRCTTTFPSTGTVSSSACTLDTTTRNSSATSNSPSSYRYATYTHTHTLISHKCLLSFFMLSFTWLYIHSTLGCHVGAAVGACTPGICPEGQREKWRHLCHGLQWHYGHHQTPHAHTLCRGEPRLGECVHARWELTVCNLYNLSLWQQRTFISNRRLDECYSEITAALPDLN